MKAVALAVRVPYGFRGVHSDEAHMAEAVKLHSRLKDEGYLPEDSPQPRWSHEPFSVVTTSDHAWGLISEGYEIQPSENVTISPRLQDVFTLAASKAAPSGPVQHFNEVVEVHTPGNALTAYNATALLQDACTDKLQEQLDAGWRIIAVCPQPDQRRPDYVLGKYEPDHVLGMGARRL